MEERYIHHILTAIKKGGIGGATQAHRSTEGRTELETNSHEPYQLIFDKSTKNNSVKKGQPFQ